MKTIALPPSCSRQPVGCGWIARLALAAYTALLASCVPPQAAPQAAPPPQQSGPFVAQYDPSLTIPEVVIRNNCDRSIDLTLTGPVSRSMSIPAHTDSSTTVPVGSYHYRAAAAGATPCSGDQFFNTQQRYVWTFFIKTVSSGG